MWWLLSNTDNISDHIGSPPGKKSIWNRLEKQGNQSFQLLSLNRKQDMFKIHFTFSINTHHYKNTVLDSWHFLQMAITSVSSKQLSFNILWHVVIPFKVSTETQHTGTPLSLACSLLVYGSCRVKLFTLLSRSFWVNVGNTNGPRSNACKHSDHQCGSWHPLIFLYCVIVSYVPV